MPGDVRAKALRNLSGRAAENLEEEIDLLGAVGAGAVDEARARVVAVLRALEESGRSSSAAGTTR